MVTELPHPADQASFSVISDSEIDVTTPGWRGWREV